MGRKLTDEAQADRDAFMFDFLDRGCTCFISLSCSWCVHPGNPYNQEEEDCWVDDDAAQVAIELLDALEG